MRLGQGTTRTPISRNNSKQNIPQGKSKDNKFDGGKLEKTTHRNMGGVKNVSMMSPPRWKAVDSSSERQGKNTAEKPSSERIKNHVTLSSTKAQQSAQVNDIVKHLLTGHNLNETQLGKIKSNVKLMDDVAKTILDNKDPTVYQNISPNFVDILLDYISMQLSDDNLYRYNTGIQMFCNNCSDGDNECRREKVDAATKTLWESPILKAVVTKYGAITGDNIESLLCERRLFLVSYPPENGIFTVISMSGDFYTAWVDSTEPHSITVDNIVTCTGNDNTLQIDDFTAPTLGLRSAMNLWPELFSTIEKKLNDETSKNLLRQIFTPIPSNKMKKEEALQEANRILTDVIEARTVSSYTRKFVGPEDQLMFTKYFEKFYLPNKNLITKELDDTYNSYNLDRTSPPNIDDYFSKSLTQMTPEHLRDIYRTYGVEKSSKEEKVLVLWTLAASKLRESSGTYIWNSRQFSKRCASVCTNLIPRGTKIGNFSTSTKVKRVVI